MESSGILQRARNLNFPEGHPAHEVIRVWLTELIQQGELPRKHKLPAERALSEALGVSRMTLRQAMHRLQEAGHIERSVGRGGGAFVAQQRPTVDISDLMGLSPQLLRTAGTAASSVLAAGTLASSARVADALRIEQGSDVHRLRRLRFADEVPVVLEDSYFPAALFPNLLGHVLTGSIYRVMDEGYNLAPVSAQEELRPALVDGVSAELLGIEPHSPVLEIFRVSDAASGERVEYSEDIFRTDRMRIVVSGRVRQRPLIEP